MKEKNYSFYLTKILKELWRKKNTRSFVYYTYEHAKKDVDSVESRGVDGEGVAEEIVGREQQEDPGDPSGAILQALGLLLEADRPEGDPDGQRYQRAVRDLAQVYLGQRWH